MSTSATQELVPETINKYIPVKVAVRIRPLVPSEQREGCQECLEVNYNSPQIFVRGTEKAFTYDYVFSSTASQQSVYEGSVQKVISQLFNGYNVTILAYGQTGSGKTYSMGTNYVASRDDVEEMGIIPRALDDIFARISDRSNEDISVKVSFMELYKERLYDLLNLRRREAIDIREDPNGGIRACGLIEIPVTSLEETMTCLEQGALNRVTGATAMNSRSSRSHAIFSLHIEIKNKQDCENVITAKFHLVDLAGSERAKKTGATGERFREGVNINKGLLALGNVISSLCGEGQRGGHIPYRDSKLTRLLQDSLGGNSHTVMIACASPADSNLEETLSTLRYADRARKIKNKPVVNRDPVAAELVRLRQQIQQLQIQLLACQAQSGNLTVGSPSEMNNLLEQIHVLEEENEKLTRALQTALDENTNMAEKALMAEMARDRLKVHLEELKSQTGNTIDALNRTLDLTVNPQYSEQINLVKELQMKIIDLQAEQQKSERAIMDHELSRHSVSTNTSLQGETAAEGQMNDDCVNSPIIGEFGAAYTLRQAKLNEQLQDLNRALAMKEQLMSKMTVNDTRIVDMKSSYEKSLKEFEDQVNILMKEKDELNQQLRNASHNPSNKIAEQRRKRLQELETLINELKKKIAEQSKMLKMKEQSEEKVKKLNVEIQSMKAARVKLIRQMKEDGEKFRQWKAQKDREVAKLKEEDRKKQCQIVKMERLHLKQQNVLKRKMEEAIAINKRLKDAMAVQKACQERRALSRDISNVSDRVKSWLEGELEVITVTKQVKQSLETLMEDRKTISEQLNKVKRQLAREELSHEMREELASRRKSLENDLELRTAQISDMQARIVEDENETSCKKRFDSVQTMVEAKCAMQYLFQVATENLSIVATHESDIRELNSQYEEVCRCIDELEKEMKTVKETHQQELSKISREHEDKILFLLRQMPRTQHEPTRTSDAADDALLQRLHFQEAEIERMSNLHELLQQKSAECEKLTKELENYSKFDFMFQTPDTHRGKGPVVTLTKVKTQDKKEDQVALDLHESSYEEENSSGEEFSSEDKNDPDWKKTPLFRRIRQIISSRGKHTTSVLEKTGGGVKRSSSGDIRCGCSKDCATKLCTCKKSGSDCCSSCKCSVLKCSNRSTNSNSASSSSSEVSKNETLLNSTFDISFKPLSENSQSKRIRLAKQVSGTGENADPSAS